MIGFSAKSEKSPEAATLFHPGASYRRPLRCVVVLQRGPSPTAEIYLRDRLAGAHVPVHYVDMRNPVTNADALFPDGAFVIIVRYLNSRFAGFMNRFRHLFSGVAYLMDDDIPVGARDNSLPFDYRFMLMTYYGRYRRFFARMCSEIWVTSEGLERRYGGGRVLRVDPMYLEPEGSPSQADPEKVRVFYHATFTHNDDAMWLRQVIGPVLEKRKDLEFELFGYRRVREAFQGLPRCHLLKERSFAGFMDYTSQNRLDIGLAPLADTPFNQGRSFNKIFDITRCGAAGIYADQPPYGAVIENRCTGVLLRRDPQAWADMVLALADDRAERRRLHENALAFCREHNRRALASPVFARFFDPSARGAV